MADYFYFPRFLFRTPTFDHRFLAANDPAKNDLIKESIFLASPELHLAIEKGRSKGLSDKLSSTVRKYTTRMSTRCTPFGIFAASGVGRIEKQTQFNIPTLPEMTAVTSLNLGFYAFIIEQLNSIREFTQKQRYYTNTSLYQFSNQFRYLERTLKNGKSNFDVAKVPVTSYLSDILTLAAKGTYIEEISKYLIDGGYAEDSQEAESFVEELIKAQLIVSEVGISLSKPNFMKFLVKKLEGFDQSAVQDIRRQLIWMSGEIDKVNAKKVGSKLQSIRQLEKKITLMTGQSQLAETRSLKTNLYITEANITLNEDIPRLIAKALPSLINLCAEHPNGLIADFRKRFFARYEHQEIPLLEALDPTIGIGFAYFTESTLVGNPFIGHFTRDAEENPPLPTQNAFLANKYWEFLKAGAPYINITDKDFNRRPEYADNLPSTFIVGTEIFESGPSPLISIKIAGSTSSANILGRFACENEDIHQLAKDIVAHEEKFLPEDTVFAEITYLPETENNSALISRPLLHQHEIAYMNEPADRNHAVDASDLYLSIDRKYELILISKKIGKKIIPRNTTAHQYENHTSPLYYFLSSMQVQENTKYRFILDWGDFRPIHHYFPRVCYQDRVILILAKWLISIVDFSGKKVNRESLLELQKSRKIPRKVWLKKSFDFKLYIDFHDRDLCEILLTDLKKGTIVLEEYLFNEETPLVQSSLGGHNNECFFNFFKTEQ
ncbi:hypothetical protein ASE74_10115 [Pedobacter sp. Leaf216]|uniref:lantibiotic dehydratase family protein n=1 Tax=Pedobacter sp. Leaf216 TaxID=1735684 RepID=UPI0006F2F6D5|nr:lantibiotic dehydratase family protein [Pedobacter sp. Leaf216]KQM65216.1 hypothetical protein ASE74_10115 [Pedobacter sp. Leaf216]